MQCRGVAVFGLVLALWVASSAQAQNWAETFTAASLASQVQAGSTRVIVVAAGADRAGAKEVTVAIEARLRSLSAALVMSDDALGAVSDLDDAAIVSRAAPMPVDRVLVVRVFAGASGAAPTAVAILYAKDGSVVTALNGTRGQPIAAAPVVTPTPVAAAPAPSGVDTRAADQVSAITRNHQASREGAQRQYDEQYVAFDDMAAVTAGGSVVATWSIPYQGKYRKPLEGADFYEAVERHDLTDLYRKKRNLKTGLIVAGLLGSSAGYVLLLYGIVAAGTEVCTGPYDCNTEYDFTLAGVGAGIALVGSIVWLVAASMNPHPIDATEARRIADQHNQRLRDRLGLSNDSAALDIPQAPKARFSWDAYASQGGAGLSLRLDL